MRINFKQFKKIRETGDKATLRDDRGHEITLAKKALNPHLLQTLSNLPLHLAEGGDVPQIDDQESSVPTSFRPPADVQQGILQGPGATSQLPADHSEEMRQKLHNAVDMFHHAKATIGNILFGSPEERAYLQGPQAAAQPANVQPAQGMRTPMMAQPQPQSAAAPNPDQSQQIPGMSGGPDAYNMIAGGLANSKAANLQEAKDIGDLNARQGQIMSETNESQKQAFMNYQNDMQDIQQEREGLIKDIKNGFIDPKHYVENMSSGQKVGSAIGILLSGIGAGLTGKENLAMKFLNDQIDRDIGAQKMNLDQKNNLLSANFRREGNLQAAMTMTRINLNDIMSHRIGEEAAKSAYPLAMDKARQINAQIDMQNAQLMQSLHMQREALRGSNQQQDPEQRLGQLRTAGVINDKEFDEASKELNAVKNHAKQRDAVLAAFDQVAKENTVAGRVGRLGAEPPSMKNYRALVVPMLKDEAGRVTEPELERVDGFMKNVFQRPGSTAENRAGLAQFLDAKAPETAHLKRLGISPNFGRMNAQGKSRFDVGKPVGNE